METPNKLQIMFDHLLTGAIAGGQTLTEAEKTFLRTSVQFVVDMRNGNDKAFFIDNFTVAKEGGVNRYQELQGIAMMWGELIVAQGG